MNTLLSFSDLPCNYTRKRKNRIIMKLLNTITRLALPTLLAAMTVTACSSDDNGDGNNAPAEKNENRNSAYPDIAATRMEVPKLQGGNSKFIVYRTSDRSFDKDGVNYCVEWDRDLKANRWSCYILTKKNVQGNGQRWKGDYNLPETSESSSYFFDLKNLTLNDYFHYKYNGGEFCYIHKAKSLRKEIDHGHLCNSQDRIYSNEINKQTFYITNMQPQYKVFNGSDPKHKYKGLWLTMENTVHNLTSKLASDDTLFICKGGTIDRADQILMRIDNDKMIIPKYFYAAVVWKHTKNNIYAGIAFWFEHKNEYHGDDPLKPYAISIAELEKKLGGKIDFFCNLPDKIEKEMKSKAAIAGFGL